MSRRTNLLIAGAALVAVGATAATAYAQAQTDRPAERRVQREVRIERDGDRVIVQRDGKRRVVRLGPGREHIAMHRDPKEQTEHLRNILQLRPNQEAALAAYVEAMKPKDRTVRMEARDDRPDTTPEKLARMERRIAEREAEQKARIDAVRRFYNQLDERQKKAFDELPLMIGPGAMPAPFRALRINLPRGELPHVQFPPEHFGHEMPRPPAPPAPPEPPRL
ncbi:Spy/CpxP family protein refolding chaperone [Phenylobacterium sp.]|jgi:hypothetical protein|uniref:Spy/CpxP family protein refolding chaperone n=1 Tax=Phenylobacterium sp. TaxID=1871053 RepID=UPI002F95997C